MKKLFIALLSLLLVMTLFACNKKQELVSGSATIIYTNDVHCYINNKIKDGDNEVDGLSYANVKALKDDLTAEGKNVLLVDAGDHVQGTMYGGFSQGEDIIKLMNATSYDLATLGNHEFDYGQYQAFKLMDLANFDYISCNFYSTSDNSLVLKPYKVLQAGDLKIAFIGITTPDTITKSSPAYFQDASGNYIYGIYSGSDGSDLYKAVQDAIDQAKKEADVIIALGHLGVDDSSMPYTSKEVIANTSGLDAFIDGHSHTKIDGDLIKDKNGNDVLLTQTKSYLAYIGQMDIEVNEGEVSINTKLIDSYDKKDDEVKALTDEIISSVDSKLDASIANSSVAFYVNDPQSGQRIVRKMETNSGDLTADAFYWYFNVKKGMNCDIAFYNGGGIKQDFPNGLLTYKDCKMEMPYGNLSCLVKLKGQAILDMLDFSAEKLPEESSILLAAGLKYSIDTSITPSSRKDDNGVWVSGPTNGYRVYDVEVYNKETKQYEPLDLDKEYTVGSTNYLLINKGHGLAMTSDGELILDYCDEDYMILAQYISAFKDNVVNSENSPLSSYENYLINYENLYGSGRITIK